MTLREWLARFGESSSSKRREAEWLLAHVLGVPRLQLPLDDVVPAAARELARRLQAGEPLQYVLGETDFFGLTLTCDPRALIPRPETEQLVELVLEHFPFRVLDVGTGTGCIALAITSRRPQAEVHAVDASPDALDLARSNAERCGLNVTFAQRDLLAGQADDSFDLIVSNLPYITTDEMAGLDEVVREHEPHSALHGGTDGLDLVRRLVVDAPRVLRSGCWLMLEIGYLQGEAVRELMRAAGFEEAEVKKDFAGHDRFVVGRTPG